MRITTRNGSIDIPNVEPRRPAPDEGMGLAMETLRDLPLNGMRYMPTAGGSGWYIWGGETKSDSADFFTAIQVRDVGDYLPTIQPFLDLPPGFRFLIDKGGRQKVWFDGSLLDV